MGLGTGIWSGRDGKLGTEDSVNTGRKLIDLHTVLLPLRFLLFMFFKFCRHGASLVAQWLRICLLMQGTRVRALVWEDPTRHGATRPVSHNY